MGIFLIILAKPKNKCNLNFFFCKNQPPPFFYIALWVYWKFQCNLTELQIHCSSDGCGRSIISSSSRKTSESVLSHFCWVELLYLHNLPNFPLGTYANDHNLILTHTNSHPHTRIHTYICTNRKVKLCVKYDIQT